MPLDLQVGDLILYPVGPASKFISKLVAWGQRLIGQAPTLKSYSHVAIVGPDTQHIFEAYWPRIRISPFPTEPIETYRIKGITPEKQKTMMAYCQSRVGEWYDMLAIITFGRLQIGGTDVCSQLAYGAGLSIETVLYPPEELESPDDIAASKEIIRTNAPPS